MCLMAYSGKIFWHGSFKFSITHIEFFSLNLKNIVAKQSENHKHFTSLRGIIFNDKKNGISRTTYKHDAHKRCWILHVFCRVEKNEENNGFVLAHYVMKPTSYIKVILLKQLNFFNAGLTIPKTLSLRIFLVSFLIS